MRKTIRTIIAMTMLLVMMTISPMTDLSRSLGGANENPGATIAKAATVAKAAGKDEQGNPLYISDIKIGNAYTEDEANPDKGMLDEAAVAAQLESEGYTVLRDGNAYANLNDGAGSKSALKKGANNKTILLGYKTTTNPREAITDLAVMNMNGGYSTDDYDLLMKTQMDSQIKPFVDDFLSAIIEYRANYRKSKNTAGFKRADLARRMLNRFTDDDTGGQPIGDLLLNKTKYEMGDDAYNRLSDSEKKKHLDILTMLMEGNGKAVLAIESYLSQATDTSEDSWLDRMQKTNIDELIDEVKKENRRLTTRADVYAELDKKYYDTALKLKKKWDESAELFSEADELGEEAIESAEERENTVEELKEETENLDPEKDLVGAVETITETQTEQMKAANDVMKLKISALSDYLSDVQYEDGTMLDFFSEESSDNKKEIRALYPMVASLSAGQISGLDFLSISDLLTIAVSDGEGVTDEDIETISITSVYEDVDREIFEPGGVAMTTEARRRDAAAGIEEDQFNVDMISGSTWGLYGAGVLFGALAIASAKIGPHVKEAARTALDKNCKTIQDLRFTKIEQAGHVEALKQDYQNYGGIKDVGDLEQGYRDAQNQLSETEKELSDLEEKNVKLQGKMDSNFYRNLAIGLAVVTVVIIMVSIWRTLEDISATYDTDFKAIPKYMVDEVDITAYNEAGERIMLKNQTAYYKVVTCNRVEGDTDIEKKHKEVMLDRNDLNGDIGKQWLALYAVKNENGYPILADSLLYRKGGSGVPDGYTTGIHEFGSKLATNLNNKKYLFASEPPEIHVFFKNTDTSVSGLLSVESGKSDASDPDQTGASDADQSDGSAASGAAGSIFSDGSESGSGISAAGLALGGGIGIVLGALLMALIMYIARRKKVAVAETDEKK